MPPAAGVRARRLPLLLLIAALAGPLPAASAQADEWITVGPGVDYRRFDLRGPLVVHVARLDSTAEGVTIESAFAGGAIDLGLETVTEMALRYDGAPLAWNGWGSRGRVLVAINGSSYDPATGEPYGGQFHSGWYALRYGDLAGGTGFVWTRDRQGLIRGCVDHDGPAQRVTDVARGQAFDIDAVNQQRPGDGLLLFTPQYGAATPSGSNETEAVVRLEAPLGLASVSRAVTGTVLEVRRGNGGTPLLFDQIVLAAKGALAPGFLSALQPGDTLALAQEITDLGFGCRQPGEFDWRRVYAGIGGGFVFLRDGEVHHSDERGAAVRDPRTAVCLDYRYVHFVVVEGRQPGLSVGMSLDDVAEFCRLELAATWGLNQDGGGSSAMWVGGRLVTSPSDGRERAVANGLLMVAVEPPARSVRFAPGFEVEVQHSGVMRLGPGSRQPPGPAVEGGRRLRIAPTAPALLGVFANGSFWWKAEFDGELGWIAEQALVAGADSLAVFQLPEPPRVVASP